MELGNFDNNCLRFSESLIMLQLISSLKVNKYIYSYGII